MRLKNIENAITFYFEVASTGITVRTAASTIHMSKGKKETLY